MIPNHFDMTITKVCLTQPPPPPPPPPIPTPRYVPPNPPPPPCLLAHLQRAYNIVVAEMQSRRFRGSHIAPFSGNMLCVLYDCGISVAGLLLHFKKRMQLMMSPVADERFRVRLLLNEEPMAPPFCRNPDSFGMCSLSEFVSHFRDMTGGSHFSDICSHPDYCPV